ncbi:MAG TPA: hypothetical protein VLV83_12460 [Acidobacteriota bacterium]|nr:hypothetical protein [Acidobacteriota bacterium]
MKHPPFRVSLVLTLVLSLLTGGGLMAQDDVLFLIVPRAVQNAGEVTGLAFANPSDETAQVTLLLLDELGESLVDPNGVPLVIPPGAQEARNLEEIFGEAALQGAAWVLAITSDISVVGFFLTSNPSASRIDGAEALVGGQLSGQIVFPEVVQSDGSSTELSVVGFGPIDEDLEVDFELRGADGSLLESANRLLPPFPNLGSQLIIAVDDLFGGPVPEDAYVLATASAGSGIVGFEQFGDQQATGGRNAIPSMPEAFDFGSSLFGAQIATGGLTSTVTLVNPTSSDADLTLTVTPTSDAPPEAQPVAVQRVLPAGGILKEGAAELFGLQGEFVGWVRIDADITGLVGDVTFGSPDGSFLSSVELQIIPVDDIVYSQVAQIAEDASAGTPGALTGITFLNPNDEVANVSIEVFDLFGFPTGQAEIVLQPGEHLPRQLFELIDGFPDQAGGSIRVRSDRPVFSFELFGFLSGGALTALSAVPPQRISGRVEGTFTVDGQPPGPLDPSLTLAAVDPPTQLTLFSAPAGETFGLLVFNGRYDLIAGTDLDGNGIICETGDLCGTVRDGEGLITSVQVGAGETVSGLEIDLTTQNAASFAVRRRGQDGRPRTAPVRIKAQVRPPSPR